MKFEIFALAGAVAAQSAPSVKVANGTLQGAKCASKDINYFLSIPYAEPPVGDGRFAAPKSFDRAYNGTLDATKPAPACLQFTTTFIEIEEHLYLDIWVPANATTQGADPLPVKVWLYGGSNAAGGISNSLYDGCHSSTDVIQVNVNYRLGPLGWMALQAAGLEGNYALQDQLLALQWVQENIEAFGGDKKRVLLYGQSAGAENSFTIATLPQAPSLISSVILESGAGRDTETIAEAQKFYEFYASQLNCSKSDLACLRSKTPEVLNQTAMNLPNYGSDTVTAPSLINHEGYGTLWGPVVDGKVVPTLPSKAGVQVPAIIGTAANEGSIFVLGQFKASFGLLNETHYDRFLTSNFGPYASTINASYPASSFDSSINAVFNAMSTIMTYYSYRCPTRRALLAAKQGVPVYTYLFNHTPSCSWVSGVPQGALPLIGATHTAELPFVFGVFDNLPGGGNCTLNATEQALSSYVQNAWASMAASSDPGAGWPAFSANESKGIVFGDEAKVDTVDYSMCDFWDKIAVGVAATAANQTAQSTQTTTGTTPSATNTNTNTNGGLRGAAARELGFLCVLFAVAIVVLF
ncbi:alpha/beta-hydrolase [Thozetella sp. PMI_491]|nr:alpha/beta-hydrolase [Thozetella sp. PMI_491]